MAGRTVVAEPELVELDSGEHATSPISIKVLAQFAGADADPFSMMYTRYICQKVKISSSGARNYNTALNNLPAFETPDENLVFGYAESSLLRNPDVHRAAYVHMALCSTLSESFSEEYGAAVLSILGERHRNIISVAPHLGQYRGIIRCFGGVLAPHEFGTIVDDRIRLNPYTESVNHCPPANTLPPPREVARLIESAFDVSAGSKKSVSLQGGDVLGWLAVYAELFLALTVSIQDKEGKTLYSSDKNGENVQVQITYRPAGDLEEEKLSKNFAGTLHLLSSATPSQPRHQSPMLPFTGRVTWQSILPKVFGRSYYKLDHAESKTFGDFLGSHGTERVHNSEMSRFITDRAFSKTLARVFELIATEDKETDTLSPQNKQNPLSWGHGLIKTISAWFPELRRFQGRMERAQKLTWEETNALHMKCVGRLTELCGCGVCERGPYNPPHAGPKEGFCLNALVETIITLALSLSRITLAAGLQPSRAGIIEIYRCQVEKRVWSKKASFAEQGMEVFTVIFGNEWNADYTRRLANTISIFSGSALPTPDPSDWPANLIAASQGGICCYVLGIGKNPKFKCGRGPDDDVIRVTSGSIWWQRKSYSRICWGVPKDMDGNESNRLDWEEIKVADFHESLWCK